MVEVELDEDVAMVFDVRTSRACIPLDHYMLSNALSRYLLKHSRIFCRAVRVASYPHNCDKLGVATVSSA